MCKRNSLDKNEASTGCVRETPQKKEKRNKHGMCKRNFPLKNKIKKCQHGICKTTPCIKRSQYRVCKRNSPHINEGRLGCVTKPPQLNIKPAQHV